jgi:circadian clock protein KaiB
MNNQNAEVASVDGEIWEFILYKAGDSPSSKKAETLLRKLCDRYLLERYHLKVVDIGDPSAILPPDILAAPTVVRTFPQPERRVIGDLSATEKAVEGLGLRDALVEA